MNFFSVAVMAIALISCSDDKKEESAPVDNTAQSSKDVDVKEEPSEKQSSPEVKEEDSAAQGPKVEHEDNGSSADDQQAVQSDQVDAQKNVDPQAGHDSQDLVAPGASSEQSSVDSEAVEVTEAKASDVDSAQQQDDVNDQDADAQKKSLETKVDEQKHVFQIKENDIVLGNKDSKVVIIEYSALSCPHCAYYHENAYQKIKEKYIDTGKIAYVVRSFIWNKQDLSGSVLALCDRDKFVPFINTLYARQQSWAFNKNFEEILTNIGQLGGISPDQYSKCLNDENIREGLIAQSKEFSDMLAAGSSKVAGTPAFIINGQLLLQPYSFNAMSAEIEKALNANDSSK
jgi:hypothetical protein